MILTGLIAAFFLFVFGLAVLIGISDARKERGYIVKWAPPLAAALSMYGVIGFFGSAILSHVDLLPNRLEWPVGWTQSAITLANGEHVVPLSSIGRIQVYDKNWEFLRGWHVETKGGSIELTAVHGGTNTDRFIVDAYRVREPRLYSSDGSRITQEPFAAPPRDPKGLLQNTDKTQWVSTYWVMLPLANPFFGWLTFVLPWLTMALASKLWRRFRRSASGYRAR